MKFNIYYETDRNHLIASNVSKEDTIKYLKSLTYAEKTHIYLEPIPENKLEDEWER